MEYYLATKNDEVIKDSFPFKSQRRKAIGRQYSEEEKHNNTTPPFMKLSPFTLFLGFKPDYSHVAKVWSTGWAVHWL